MMRQVARTLGLVAVVVAMAVPVGCGGETDQSANREVDAYTAVVDWVLAEPRFTTTPDPDDKLIVFIESLASGVIDLDVQIEVVGHFEELAEIRFIDTREEAVDQEEPGAPVRDGGMLLGLGAVPATGPLELRGEVYRTVDDVVGYRFMLENKGPKLVLIGPPEEVEPEGLVAAP